jgi:hypothetical protein
MKACLLPLLLLPLGLHAKCIEYPPILATVRVESCQTMNIKSSQSRRRTEGGASYQLHQPGDSFEATVISGLVEKVSYVSLQPDDVSAFPLAPYIPLGPVQLELHGSADTACPSELPATLTVLGDRRCCDTTPHSGACISPFERVKREHDPARWHELDVSADGT